MGPTGETGRVGRNPETTRVGRPWRRNRDSKANRPGWVPALDRARTIGRSSGGRPERGNPGGEKKSLYTIGTNCFFREHTFFRYSVIPLFKTDPKPNRPRHLP